MFKNNVSLWIYNFTSLTKKQRLSQCKLTFEIQCYRLHMCENAHRLVKLLLVLSMTLLLMLNDPIMQYLLMLRSQYSGLLIRHIRKKLMEGLVTTSKYSN